MTKQAKSVAIILLIFLGIFSVLAALGWYSFLNSPVITSAEGYKYKVSAGSTYKIVSAELHQQHILKHPLLFNLLFRLRGDTHNLKAGEYYFAWGELPGKLIDQMVFGTGLVYHSVTIVPGTNFRQLRTLINNNPDIAHLSENMSDADLMKKLGFQGIFPEGRFFPDTYYFVAGSSDLVLLKRAYTLMQQKLLKSWENRASNLPFRTPYDALIAASIIEKEAYLSDELPIIAGVMTNRLRKGILLQFDPTVIYGVGLQYNGTIYKHDLRATNNPYNTYVHKGLPPTPISMPGRLAIDAVMHPDENNYLYFVARGDGGHQFSSTLAQHSVAVRTARSNHSWYFNTALVKQYLIKTIQQQR